MKVLLDANALMMPVQFQIDIFDELRMLFGNFEPVILAGIRKELTGLSRARGKTGVAARFGLSLCAHCTIVESDEYPDAPIDEQIISYAVRNRCMVVTNDRNIRENLLRQGISIISLRKQKKLEILQR